MSQFISVPVAAVLLIALTVTGSFRRWRRFMYVLILVNPERQWRQRLAGMRTTALVATGACLFVVLSDVHSAARVPIGSLLRSSRGSASWVTYEFRAVCRAEDEAQVRALLVQAFSSSAFTLRELQSEDITGSARVKVRAFLLAHGADQTQLEQAVSRLSLEPGVSAVSWQLKGPDAESMSVGAEDVVPASNGGWRRLTGSGK